MKDEVGELKAGRKGFAHVPRGGLTISLAAVSHPKDANALRAIVDFVNDAVIADTDAPATGRACELFRSRWSGLTL
jgi:hypothetical protein